MWPRMFKNTLENKPIPSEIQRSCRAKHHLLLNWRAFIITGRCAALSVKPDGPKASYLTFGLLLNSKMIFFFFYIRNETETLIQYLRCMVGFPVNISLLYVQYYAHRIQQVPIYRPIIIKLLQSKKKKKGISGEMHQRVSCQIMHSCLVHTFLNRGRKGTLTFDTLHVINGSLLHIKSINK